jgi:hypothetical protein
VTFHEDLTVLKNFPGRKYNPTAPEIAPARNQLSVRSNERLRNGLGRSSIAYALVHTGFFQTQIPEIAEDLADIRSPGKHEEKLARRARQLVGGERGDYGAYLDHTASLCDFLGQTAAPVIIFTAEREAYQPAWPRSSVSTPDNAFVVVTENETSTPVRDVRVAPDHRDASPQSERQDMNLLFGALIDAGVKTLYIGGEYTFNPWSHHRGCAGMTAARFSKVYGSNRLGTGLNVQGIAETVFPRYPEKIVHDPDGVKHMLLDNAVPLERAIDP